MSARLVHVHQFRHQVRARLDPHVGPLEALCAIVPRGPAGAARRNRCPGGCPRDAVTTWASFHPRFTASWMPRPIPCPPEGGGVRGIRRRAAPPGGRSRPAGWHR